MENEKNTNWFITVTESERGWGSESWTESFPSYKEAKARVHEINSKNTSPTVPSWYMVATEPYVR